MLPSARCQVVLCSSILFLAGCGVGLQTAGTTSVNPAAPSTAPGINGHVHGGQQPLIASKVYLYAVSTTATAGPATSLLNGLGYVPTDLNGDFSITNDYTCPSGAYVYLLALGGNPGLAGGGVNNPDIALATGLGLCSALGDSSVVTLNEVTTVATAYSLASYATSETQIGSTYSLSAAFANIPGLADPTHGGATASNSNEIAPQAKINTLANSIAACINSTGIGAPCSTLMSAANVTGANGTPVDTFQAALNIAKSPTVNVGDIFNLSSADAVFAPTLSSAPSDWTLTAMNLNCPITADANTYEFNTNQGTIFVELRPDIAPKNVANFAYYVNNGLYNQSFFHRLVPGFVVQGGGYTFTNGNANSIPTALPVVNEAQLPNLRGTLAMALTGSDPNSATDEFFFNLENNPSLNNPDASLSSGGYTVIGQIVGVQGGTPASGSAPVDGGSSAGLAVMDAIGADSTYNFGSPFDALPLINYTSGSTVLSSNFVYPNISQVNPATPANTVATPVFSPLSCGSSYSATQPITLTDSTPGAVIYYYIFSTPGGGDNPNQNAVQYTGPITLPASTFVVAFATATGYTPSLYNYQYYTIQ
jgi:cyclophilin family peptidyl-prolyl cis-trans isomerase